MRILFFVYRYWPIVGGVEKYIHELAKALLDMGHEVDVVTGATVEGLAEFETHQGIRIHRFPAMRSPARCRLWLWRRFHLFVRADVINVSNTHMLEYYWRMIGFMVNRRKLFLTRHGMSYVYPVPESEKRRAMRTQQVPAGIVHDGLFIEKWLGQKPDLCPDQGLAPQAGDLTPVPEPPPTSAAFIGRLEPDSGISVYIDAVRRLTSDRSRHFELDIYGDGTLMQELRDMVSRENLPVRFHGPTSNAQNRISDSCFAFIDGRMAMQEAMARRRLVFAAYVDPLKQDYVGTEPFSPHLVPVADGAQLADRVEHFIEHPRERAEMVARAFEYARGLSWTQTANAYLEFWQERVRRPVSRATWSDCAKLAWRLNREAVAASGGEVGWPKPRARRAAGDPVCTPGSS